MPSASLAFGKWKRYIISLSANLMLVKYLSWKPIKFRLLLSKTPENMCWACEPDTGWQFWKTCNPRKVEGVRPGGRPNSWWDQVKHLEIEINYSSEQTETDRGMQQTTRDSERFRNDPLKKYMKKPWNIIFVHWKLAEIIKHWEQKAIFK